MELNPAIAFPLVPLMDLEDYWFEWSLLKCYNICDLCKITLGMETLDDNEVHLDIQWQQEQETMQKAAGFVVSCLF